MHKGKKKSATIKSTTLFEMPIIEMEAEGHLREIPVTTVPMIGGYPMEDPPMIKSVEYWR